MKARAALVGERPSHERGQETLAHGDLLHGGAQHERAVGGVEGLRVLDVDLVLRVHELVVRGERLQPELVAPEQHPQHDLARIGDGPDRVDAGELVDVTAQAALCRRVALEEEELELRGNDRRQPALGVGGDDTLEQRTGADGPVLRAVQCPGLAEAPGHLRLPRHLTQRLEVGADREVDVSFLAADDRRVVQVGSHHRGAEGGSLLAHVGEMRDRDVLAARDAVQVGVEQAHGPHALLSKGGGGRARIMTCVHARPSRLGHARTRTGMRLIPLKKFDRSRSGRPASSIRPR